MLILFQIFLSLPAFGQNYSFYSETAYDSRIDGATNESRLLFHKNLEAKWLDPYLGITYSQDLSNGRAPLFSENAVSPTTGLRLRLIPYFVFYSELRRLYRFNNKTNRKSSENELRYGFFGYHFQDIQLIKNSFNEIYGEVVAIERVDSQPVAVVWNKLGLRYLINSNIRPDLYLEGFTRQSPNLNYGPQENEFRLGTRVTFLMKEWALGLLVNYALLSNIKTNEIDALFFVSREAF